MNSFSVLKTSFVAALMVASATASAFLTPGNSLDQNQVGAIQPLNRTARVTLNQSLAHAEVLQVRKLLSDLLKGDNVISIDLVAQALQPNAYLEIIVDSQVVGTLPLRKRLEVVSLPLNLRNGIDYQRLLVRSIGSSLVQTLAVQIGTDGPLPPLPPVPPQPPLPPQPPQPPLYPGPDLRGYCEDWDHSQFTAAKSFAYSTQGLDMTDANATNWALNYNQSHACGTINEYKARFSVLKNFAYSTQGLDMTAAQAIQYALSKVEFVTVEEAQRMQNTLSAIKNFAYATQGLDLTGTEAARIAREWIDRGYCEDANGVQAIASQYKRDFDFAYSSGGLNYDRARAKEYALSRVRGMSRCGDLLH